MRVHNMRTWLRSSRLTGPLIQWGWRHYLTAMAELRPSDCDPIPKVPGAGRVVRDEASGPYQLMHNGIKASLNGYYSGLYSNVIRTLRGHHEPQEERAFHEVLQTLPEKITMIEAGGYWAYYSLWAQKEKPLARNIVIEPMDAHIAVGKANFELNGMQAEFVRAYVGSTVRPPHLAEFDGNRIPDLERISIDSAIDRLDIPFVHILHGDVQGAEVELLKGARRAIGAGKVGYVFLSTHDRSLHRASLEELRSERFVILAQHTREESYTADGLIVARDHRFPGPDSIPISVNHRRRPLLLVNHFLQRTLRALIPGPRLAVRD